MRPPIGMSMHDCAGDCIVARRTFLKDVSIFAAALVAAGLAPRAAEGAPSEGASSESALSEGAPSPIRALARTLTDVRYPIPPRDGVSFDDTNEVILVRYTGHVYAFSLSCPHQNTALKTDPGGDGFRCTKHESRYKFDGQYISGRATRNMDRFAIRRDGGVVVVDVAKWYESDSEPTQWAGAVITI